MLFSCCKYVILERPSWKLPSALSKNCVSIFIYFCINICFCIKQANKICTFAEFAFVNVNSIFGPMLLFYEGYNVLVSHPNKPRRTGINFSELRHYKAVRCSEGTRKLVVKRSLSTCQPRSQCFSLPIYFLQSFWVQYFASNHMSSQAIYPRLLPWHLTTMIDNTKTISCTVRATYYARTDLFRRTNVWGPVSQRASSGMTS